MADGKPPPPPLSPHEEGENPNTKVNFFQPKLNSINSRISSAFNKEPPTTLPPPPQEEVEKLQTIFSPSQATAPTAATDYTYIGSHRIDLSSSVNSFEATTFSFATSSVVGLNLTDISNRSVCLPPPSYHNGKPAVFFRMSDKQRLIEAQKFLLIAKFSHRRPPLESLKQFFISQHLQGSFNLSIFDSKHIIIECELLADFVKIWLKQNWIIHGCPVRFFKWTENFHPSLESSTYPVWIHLPGLPLYMYEEGALLLLASAFGFPLYIDPNNINRKKLSYASFCVEWDVLKAPIEALWVAFDEGNSVTPTAGFLQKVVYGKVPSYCSFCSDLGHSFISCKRRSDWPHEQNLRDCRNEMGSGSFLGATANEKEVAPAVEECVAAGEKIVVGDSAVAAGEALSVGEPATKRLIITGVINKKGESNLEEGEILEDCLAIERTVIAGGCVVGTALGQMEQESKHQRKTKENLDASVVEQVANNQELQNHFLIGESSEEMAGAAISLGVGFAADSGIIAARQLAGGGNDLLAASVQQENSAIEQSTNSADVATKTLVGANSWAVLVEEEDKQGAMEDGATVCKNKSVKQAAGEVKEQPVEKSIHQPVELQKCLQQKLELGENAEKRQQEGDINVPGLPLYLYKEDVLMSIANAIGRPLALDLDNINRSKLGCASFCVEVDISIEVIDKIWIEFEVKGTTVGGTGFWQKVIFDRLPPYCSGCAHLGHNLERCLRLKKLKDNVQKVGFVEGEGVVGGHHSKGDSGVAQMQSQANLNSLISVAENIDTEVQMGLQGLQILAQSSGAKGLSGVASVDHNVQQGLHLLHVLAQSTAAEAGEVSAEITVDLEGAATAEEEADNTAAGAASENAAVCGKLEIQRGPAGSQDHAGEQPAGETAAGVVTVTRNTDVSAVDTYAVREDVSHGEGAIGRPESLTVVEASKDPASEAEQSTRLRRFQTADGEGFFCSRNFEQTAAALDINLQVQVECGCGKCEAQQEQESKKRGKHERATGFQELDASLRHQGKQGTADSCAVLADNAGPLKQRDPAAKVENEVRIISSSSLSDIEVLAQQEMEKIWTTTNTDAHSNTSPFILDKVGSPVPCSEVIRTSPRLSKVRNYVDSVKNGNSIPALKDKEATMKDKKLYDTLRHKYNEEIRLTFEEHQQNIYATDYTTQKATTQNQEVIPDDAAVDKKEWTTVIRRSQRLNKKQGK